MIDLDRSSATERCALFDHFYQFYAGLDSLTSYRSKAKADRIRQARPFLFRLDRWDGPNAYPIEDQRPGHRIELAPIGGTPR